MKIEGIENVSVEDLKRLIKYRNDQINYWSFEYSPEILDHEIELRDAYQDELHSREIVIVQITKKA